MKRDTKHFAASIYFLVCLFALCGEPTNEKAYLAYYGTVIANMGFAAFLTNKFSSKKKDANTTSTDGNRIS